ncbi:MAG: hypothetical protein IPI28_19180 [Candidatus Omnitrophica bacterium]|nr:hypothetical protein [Candidatus Omnitrophota bacterium]
MKNNRPRLPGIVMIVTGSYVLNLSKVTSGFLGPFRAIAREPGSKLMLLVSFIYAFTSVIGKLAVLHSNPYVFGSLYNITLTALMVALIPFSRAADPVKEITKKALRGLDAPEPPSPYPFSATSSPSPWCRPPT